MKLHISDGMNLPIYVQITEQLKYLIRSGQLSAGTQLPTPVHLSRNLHINKNTITRAYQELRREGYITVRNGSGSFVARASPEPYDLASQTAFARGLDATIERGLELGLEPGQLASMVLMRAQALANRSRDVTALFVECN